MIISCDYFINIGGITYPLINLPLGKFKKKYKKYTGFLGLPRFVHVTKCDEFYLCPYPKWECKITYKSKIDKNKFKEVYAKDCHILHCDNS